MNRRTVVSAAFVALCLGVLATSTHAVDLSYPVAFDDRTGPIYYQNASLFAPATTFAPTTTSTISTSYLTEGPLYEPAPTYAPPPPTYAPPAQTYNPPAPIYSAPASAYPQPVPAPVVVPAYTQPTYVRQTVTTTYAPPRPAYGPTATYAGSMSYVPRVTYAPTCVTTYREPVAVGPRVWVHPKVYVEGQPIRNLIRAITP